MFRRDNILRVIEQLSNSVAIIRSVVNKEDYDEAQFIFATDAESFVQIPYLDFVTDKSNGWFDLIETHYGTNIAVYENFANLLLEGAEIAFESHRITEGFFLVTKCQRLYSHVESIDRSYSIQRETNLERLALLILKFSN